MKTLSCSEAKIERLILGRISYKPPLIHPKRKIFITRKRSWMADRCAAVIYVGKGDGLKSRCASYVICNEKDVTDYLHDGDVVRINPNGEVIKLYDTRSPHNSLFVTSQCNCRCIMCPQVLYEKDEMSLDDMVEYQIEAIRLMNPRNKSLGITGGEPTLLKNGLLRIIKACKKYLPNTAVTILTNGMAFRDIEYTKSLALIGHPDLVLAVALYGNNDTEHDNIVNRKGAFYDVVQGLYNLALCRQRIEIRTVINAFTYKRLPQYSEFIYRNFPFVVHIALMGMEMTETARKNAEILWVAPNEMANHLSDAVLALSQRNMFVSVYNMPLCVVPREIEGFCVKSISDWKKAYKPECKECDKFQSCGGFFESAESYFGPHIKPFKSS